MTTKREIVKQYIQQQGEGWQYSTREMHEMVLGLEVSPSTIRTAMNELKSIGAINADFVYTGRFARPFELLETLFADDPDNWNYLLLTDSKRDELCAKLFTTPLMLIQALDWASCYMTVTSTYYGMSYRLNEKGRKFIEAERAERDTQRQPVRVAACEVAAEQPSYEASVEPEDLGTTMLELGAQETPATMPAKDTRMGDFLYQMMFGSVIAAENVGVVDDDVNIESAPITTEPHSDVERDALMLVAMLKDAPIAPQPTDYAVVPTGDVQKLEAENATMKSLLKQLIGVADMLPGMAKVHAMQDTIHEVRIFLKELSTE